MIKIELLYSSKMKTPSSFIDHSLITLQSSICFKKLQFLIYYHDLFLKNFFFYILTCFFLWFGSRFLSCSTTWRILRNLFFCLICSYQLSQVPCQLYHWYADLVGLYDSEYSQFCILSSRKKHFQSKQHKNPIESEPI